jgi:hypothetical protein
METRSAWLLWIQQPLAVLFKTASNWFGVSPAFQLLNGDGIYIYKLSYEAA